MAVAEKRSWEDIPSLGGLEIEWDYQPENPQGRRQSFRIGRKHLNSIFDTGEIPVKVLSRDSQAAGMLEDISDAGLSVLTVKQFGKGTPVKVGFFLGRKKIVARAVVKNISHLEGKYRLGLAFDGIGDSDAAYILGLVPSSVYNY